MKARTPVVGLISVLLFLASTTWGDVYVRFKMTRPEGTRYHVKLGGYIHKSPWYLPRAVWPEQADKAATNRVPSGIYTPWFNLGQHAGDRLHGRLNRAGGIAEFPNVTVEFVADAPSEIRTVEIQLADAPKPGRVVKTFQESYRGSLTSFLVSLNLKEDAPSLETASQMTARRLEWARKASGGRRTAPTEHILQTSFWGPQREELNVREGEVLWLLGFNVVGNLRPEVKSAYAFKQPAHTHSLNLSPSVTREQVAAKMEQVIAGKKFAVEPGIPLGFSDEICARPPIGDNEQGRQHFRDWLKKRGVKPGDWAVSSLGDVRPIETPLELEARKNENEAAARRVFYYTSRFRQQAGTERLRWHSETAHRILGDDPLTTTLVADHPYFGGTGLGMGMVPNTTWGGYPLALDWFELVRDRAVDLIGIEDWMGLQFMYGPDFTWEGFQLMGFQANIMRSGGRGEVPIIAWITPSDETNLVLKSTSALCQGARHFFYWTYGPTVTSTENYWSDLESAYTGIVTMSRLLARSEPILARGRHRSTKLAMLYSLSSDLWQPFGYIHMLERRLTYFSLIHQQYRVDFLTEEDIAAGRLTEYEILYTVDPCIHSDAVRAIRNWVERGGFLYGACAAGSRNEFGEEVTGLADVFGIAPGVETRVQQGRYRFRGALNALNPMDDVRLPDGTGFCAVGTIDGVRLDGGEATAYFKDKAPAVIDHRFGRGRARYVATSPGMAYGRDARFVRDALKEQWPAVHRNLINRLAVEAGVDPLVELSHDVVEAGVYDHETGTALVLANFTYRPIDALGCSLAFEGLCRSVESLSHGPLDFVKEKGRVAFTLPLGLNDVVLIRR